MDAKGKKDKSLAVHTSDETNGGCCESEPRYQQLVEMMNEGLARADSNYIFSYVNSRFAEMLGYAPEEMVGHSLLDFVNPDNLEFIKDQIARRKRGEAGRFEMAWASKDGRKVYTLVSPRPVLDGEGNFAGSVAVLTDVTDRKEAEEALKESEERYRSLVEFSPDMVTVTTDGKIAYANPAAATLVGAEKPEDLVGRSPLHLIHPRYRDAVKERMRLMIEEGKTVPIIEEQFLRMDGTWVDVEVAAMPVSYKGKPSILAVMRDITERKRAEEAVKASESNYRAIFNAVNDAIFIHDMETGMILDVNDKMVEMYGYSPEEAREVDVEAMSAGEPPYSQEEALKWIRRAVKGKPQLFEWMAKDRSGRVFWVEVNLKRASVGGEHRLLAVVRDITERKQAEQSLRELESHKRDFYRRTIQAATEGKLIITEKEDIEQIAGPPVASWEIGKGEDLGAIRQAVRALGEKAGMDPDPLYDFVLTVGESTTNAYKHAGGGTASLHSIPDGLMFVVSDNGPGIEALTLPEVALVKGYSTAGTLGMGYKAILSIADKVYLATGPGGTTVAIATRLHPAPKPVEAALLPDTWTS